VPPIAIIFGVLLSILGLVLVALTGAPTALIPVGFGVVLIALGISARNPKARKHAMHGAALVALIGFLIPAWRAISALAGGAEFGRAVIGNLIMAVLCAVFLVLCINSFIAARRARREKQASPPA
jgi:hypothetical protein